MKRYIALILISVFLASCEKKEMEDDNKPPANLKLGDNYGGGIVFHLFKEGGGLIMASKDAAQKVAWGCRESYLNPTTSEVFGTGKENTKIILEQCKQEWIAAKLADDFILDGHDDWYLPSHRELLAMRIMHISDLKGGGNFSKGYYWSSSQTSSKDKAWAAAFGGEPYDTDVKDKDEKLFVRPIRRF